MISIKRRLYAGNIKYKKKKQKLSLTPPPPPPSSPQSDEQQVVHVVTEQDMCKHGDIIECNAKIRQRNIERPDEVNSCAREGPNENKTDDPVQIDNDILCPLEQAWSHLPSVKVFDPQQSNVCAEELVERLKTNVVQIECVDFQHVQTFELVEHGLCPVVCGHAMVTIDFPPCVRMAKCVANVSQVRMRGDNVKDGAFIARAMVTPSEVREYIMARHCLPEHVKQRTCRLCFRTDLLVATIVSRYHQNEDTIPSRVASLCQFTYELIGPGGYDAAFTMQPSDVCLKRGLLYPFVTPTGNSFVTPLPQHPKLRRIDESAMQYRSIVPKQDYVFPRIQENAKDYEVRAIHNILTGKHERLLALKRANTTTTSSEGHLFMVMGMRQLVCPVLAHVLQNSCDPNVSLLAPLQRLYSVFRAPHRVCKPVQECVVASVMADAKRMPDSSNSRISKLATILTRALPHITHTSAEDFEACTASICLHRGTRAYKEIKTINNGISKTPLASVLNSRDIQELAHIVRMEKLDAPIDACETLISFVYDIFGWPIQSVSLCDVWFSFMQSPLSMLYRFLVLCAFHDATMAVGGYGLVSYMDSVLPNHSTGSLDCAWTLFGTIVRAAVEHVKRVFGQSYGALKNQRTEIRAFLDKEWSRIVALCTPRSTTAIHTLATNPSLNMRIIVALMNHGTSLPSSEGDDDKDGKKQCASSFTQEARDVLHQMKTRVRPMDYKALKTLIQEKIQILHSHKDDDDSSSAATHRLFTHKYNSIRNRRRFVQCSLPQHIVHNQARALLVSSSTIIANELVAERCYMYYCPRCFCCMSQYTSPETAMKGQYVHPDSTESYRWVHSCMRGFLRVTNDNFCKVAHRIRRVRVDEAREASSNNYSIRDMTELCCPSNKHKGVLQLMFPVCLLGIVWFDTLAPQEGNNSVYTLCAQPACGSIMRMDTETTFWNEHGPGCLTCLLKQRMQLTLRNTCVVHVVAMTGTRRSASSSTAAAVIEAVNDDNDGYFACKNNACSMFQIPRTLIDCMETSRPNNKSVRRICNMCKKTLVSVSSTAIAPSSSSPHASPTSTIIHRPLCHSIFSSHCHGTIVMFPGFENVGFRSICPAHSDAAVLEKMRNSSIPDADIIKQLERLNYVRETRTLMFNKRRGGRLENKALGIFLSRIRK